jgi:hypothetical protein
MLPSRLMPIEQIVGLLLAERDKLNRAIEALAGSAKHRNSSLIMSVLKKEG